MNKSRNWIVFWVGLLSVLQFSVSANAETCTSYHSTMLDKKIDYCIDRTTPDVSPLPGEAVAYFMHGTNGNAQTWVKNNYSASLDALRKSGQTLPAMTFVSFSTSRYSFFTDHPGKPKKAWETWFITEFIPYIESTYGVCNKKECRALIGESMGGFGALKTALRHTDLFATVAVNSPALPAFSIREKISSWEAFFTHHKIGPVYGFLLIEIVRHIFNTEDAWDANDPIHLVQTLPAEEFPSLYFDMGGRDDYGFNVGYGIFKNILDQRGISYSTHFEPNAVHDMWERHAGDSIQFVMNHIHAHSSDTN